MKNKLVFAALFIGTALAISLYPLARGFANHQLPPPKVILDKPTVEAVFVLDTTGSMGGMIETAKEKIWSIAATMATAQPSPEIKIGLVAYRDRGDSYVTKTVDLSSDLDSVYAQLMQLQAEGGGDGPESVNKALAEAVQQLSWSEKPGAYKVIFLVGDAPPHMDYQDELQFPALIQLAKQRGIVVNAIQCGDDLATQNTWQQIAALSQGAFLKVAQSGGGVQLATPFDQEMANLSQALDQSKVFYGSKEELAAMEAKQATSDAIHESASPASAARRAEFNISDSGKKNLYGEKELVEELTRSGRQLKDMDQATLPEPLQTMSDTERERWLQEKIAARSALERQISTLATKRQAYLKQEAAKLDTKTTSLDHQVYSVLKSQGETKGLQFEGDGPRY